MNNQLTPAGIYVSRLHEGVNSIYATAGEAAFRLFAPYTVNFADSLAGQSLIALLNVIVHFSERRGKDKQKSPNRQAI